MRQFDGQHQIPEEIQKYHSSRKNTLKEQIGAVLEVQEDHDMTRSETTAWLSKMLENKINPNDDPRIYWAKEVTFNPVRPPEGYQICDFNGKPYRPSHIRVDYMVFRPVNNSPSGIERGSFYAYEIKSSVEDFTSGHGLNFVGDYNYIVTLQSVYEKIKDRIPWKVGVICQVTDDIGGLSGIAKMKTVKKAQRMDRTRSCAEMLLMMFRSANRVIIGRQTLR